MSMHCCTRSGRTSTGGPAKTPRGRGHVRRTLPWSVVGRVIVSMTPMAVRASWSPVRLCLAMLLVTCQASLRRTRVVDCSGGSDHVHCGWAEAPCGTIQYALDRSSNGDRIEVKPGVCKGQGNYDLRFRGLEVELIGRGWTSAAGPAVEISCDESGRGFKFQHNEGIRSVIHGFLVRGCQADYGGAVWCDNASPVFDHVVFKNNKAGYAGGAIYWLIRGPVLRDCEFEQNRAISYGPDQASEFTTVHVPDFPLQSYAAGESFPGVLAQAGSVLCVCVGLCFCVSRCLWHYGSRRMVGMSSQIGSTQFLALQDSSGGRHRRGASGIADKMWHGRRWPASAAS